MNISTSGVLWDVGAAQGRATTGNTPVEMPLRESFNVWMLRCQETHAALSIKSVLQEDITMPDHTLRHLLEFGGYCTLLTGVSGMLTLAIVGWWKLIDLAWKWLGNTKLLCEYLRHRQEFLEWRRTYHG
jgi:hypothetical protein